MTATMRVASPEDAAAILTIYAPIVRETAISFEVEPPTRAEMHARITTTLRHLPWLVCAREGEVLGYVYASPHRARAAYQWSVDVSVYIHAQARRTGMGRALYQALFQLLVLQGFYQIPPDLVVKLQHVDIVEVILRWILCPSVVYKREIKDGAALNI